MPFEDQQVKELLELKPNREHIDAGKAYESRLRVLTQPMHKPEITGESGYFELKNIMYKTLDKDKAQATERFFRFPLPINSISSDVAGDLFRVFEGRNANFSIQYPNETVAQRADAQLANIDVRRFITRWGKNALTYAPNSFVAIDKKESGETCLLYLFNNDIICYEWSDYEHVELNFFAYKVRVEKRGNQNVEIIAFYDDERYRLIERIGSNYNIVVNNPHTMGKCPVRPFWTNTLNSSNSFNRFSYFGRSSGVMSEWTLMDVYNRFAEMTNVYPVIEMDKPSCTDPHCEDGIINKPLANGEYDKKSCETCKKSKIVGPATIVQVDTAKYAEEKDASGVFRYVVPPVGSLEFEQELQSKREQFIKRSITGYNDVLEKEAINTDQVRGLMEDRKKPLLEIAEQLNALHKWIVEGIVKVDYNTSVNVHANYGTEWFLLTEEQIQKLFSDAKKAGLPESEIDQIYRLLVETKYKGNPQTVQKLIIENNLNPAPYHSLEECYTKLDKGVMNREDLAIKANITSLIMRFERENGSIVSFAEEGIASGRLTFADKINTIRQTFITYLNIETNEQQDTGEQGEQQGDTSS